MAAGQVATAFWDQSQASFAAVLRGAAERERRDYERTMWGAWQGERFTRTDKLKGWKVYQREIRKAAPKKRQTDAEKLDVFRSLAAAGAGLRITRLGPKVPSKSEG